MKLPRSAETYARSTLAFDAVYYAVMGLLAIVFRDRIGGLLRVPGLLVAVLAGAVIGWAYVAVGQAVRIDWRRGVKQMVVANSVAATLLALGAALHPGRGASALMAFISLDVISIAVAQALSLSRRDPKP